MKHCITKFLILFTLLCTPAFYSYATPSPEASIANSDQSSGFQPLDGGFLASLLFKEPFHGLRVADVLLLLLLTAGLVFLLKYRADRLKRYLTPRPEPTINDESLASLSTTIQQDLATTESPTSHINKDKTIPFHISFKMKPTDPPKNDEPIATDDLTKIVDASADQKASDLAAHYAQFDLPKDLQPELFLDQAKILFKRIHQAWLAKDQQTLKHYTTPELFERLSLSLSAKEQTAIELLTVFADITSASNLGDLAMISVKFHGWSKAKANKEVEAYCEIWHLENLQQDSQWLITGIQSISGNLKFNNSADHSSLNSTEINQ
ncbi:Tim44 domain-containing protein [Endozoicomonas sp. SM1973]|uniref:Tim44 domain-containing protein n=1 Tax=Spartinivicinus marinus TaxID=2994442 RepID=A0A853I8T6_9GAMM|nr:Tim44-like domain-containing protein [Spartinivicinus marinus]MCX4025246.1 Tim44-like domain-containing protein [Spartinivicinus marinus]NYZ65967.1 Tim44 domain-containing protein [Spartinivicinus marinus]